MLQQAQVELLSLVADKANRNEEDFFEEIEGGLHNLCKEIAKEIGTDSAAVFFVTEDNPSGSKPFIVMRGASGQLKNTLDERLKGWREWRSGNIEEHPDLSGFAYPSKLTDEFLALRAEERQQDIKGWSVTNQIWHLATGRIANSNRAMDELHGGHSRTGQGDIVAYPGKNLHTTFHTMVGVPIFAQGGGIPAVHFQEDEKAKEKYPASASSSIEFLSKYRVIGILKVEGKQPPYDEVPDVQVLTRRLEELFEREEIKELNFSDREKQCLRTWCELACNTTNLWKDPFSDGDKDSSSDKEIKPPKFPNLLQNKRSDGREKDDDERKRSLLLRKGIADVFTGCCHAEFTRQDMELLVLLAMQVGRLMTCRVINYAAAEGIIIRENEVGLLNVRWRDINHLVALGKAAEAAKRKTEYHLKALESELDFDKRQEIYRARVSEVLDPHGPIRDLSARRKEFVSLIRKLMHKQRHLEDNPYVYEISFTGFKCKLEGYGIRPGEQRIARGSANVFLHRPNIGKGAVDVMMKLGMEGAPQVTLESKNLPVALDHYQNIYDPDLPLARRILDANIYHVDDLAGARIITDYDSDIDEMLDELRARVGEWGIELSKVDDLREGKEGGYRAAHVTLYVDVEPLLSFGDVQTLREALQLPEGQSLRMPVEVQLRTAYQHSWALKTHGTSYKREGQISQELHDEQEILSNVLAEADCLSDIVRSGIENILLPSDYGERILLEFLNRRIPRRDGLNVVKFGIACAKEILKDKLRYNGQPEYSFAIEVCERLVYNFGEIDPNMLLLVLLRNVWRAERGEVGWPTLASEPTVSERDDDIILLFCERLERMCPSIVRRYRKRLPIPFEQQQDQNWFRIWMAQFPTWFWAVQRSFRYYFLQPAEDEAKQWKERLQNVYDGLRRHHKEGQWLESFDAWLEHAYVMEAAILLANLTELPFEPGSARRKQLHNNNLSLFREIRRYLPNGSTKTHVIEELDSAFREIETLLDLPREPEWWGE